MTAIPSKVGLTLLAVYWAVMFGMTASGLGQFTNWHKAGLQEVRSRVL